MGFEDITIKALNDMLQKRYASLRKKPTGENKLAPPVLPLVNGKRNWHELAAMLDCSDWTEEEWDRMLAVDSAPTSEETAVYEQWKEGKEAGDLGKHNIRVRNGGRETAVESGAERTGKGGRTLTEKEQSGKELLDLINSLDLD